MGEGHKKLNFSDCMGLAIGQIIGSGIMVLTGIVIGLTGHGIAAAFILGAVLAIITCVPFIILTSAIPSSGAGFTYIRRLMGEKAMSASMSAEKRFRAPTFFTFWPMCSRSIPTGCLQKIPQ